MDYCPPAGGGGGAPPPGGFGHQGGCSCCADAFVDDGEFGSEDLNTYIVRLPPAQPAAARAPPVTRRALQVSESIRCLNESREGAAKTMFAKGWCHKLAEDPFLESDAVRSPTPSPRAGLLGWLSRIGLGARRTSS